MFFSQDIFLKFNILSTVFSIRYKTNVLQKINKLVLFARINAQVKVKVQEDVLSNFLSLKNAMFLIS